MGPPTGPHLSRPSRRCGPSKKVHSRNNKRQVLEQLAALVDPCGLAPPYSDGMDPVIRKGLSGAPFKPADYGINPEEVANLTANPVDIYRAAQKHCRIDTASRAALGASAESSSLRWSVEGGLSSSSWVHHERNDTDTSATSFSNSAAQRA